MPRGTVGVGIPGKMECTGFKEKNGESDPPGLESLPGKMVGTRSTAKKCIRKNRLL